MIIYDSDDFFLLKLLQES